MVPFGGNRLYLAAGNATVIIDGLIHHVGGAVKINDKIVADHISVRRFRLVDDP